MMKQWFIWRRLVALIGIGGLLLGLSSCKSDDDEVADLSEEGTNDWIYKVMSNYYLWYEDMPEKDRLNFSQSPDKFFETLLSDEDGVQFGDDWLPFSSIEQKEEATKSISASDSYGFEFATYKSGNNYYVWVLYVLPGSPAAEAGLKRGDWVIAVGSDTPNISNLSALQQGAATTFQLAEAKVEGKKVTFYRTQSISVAASRAVEDTPFLKDSVYTIGGKRIGYLMYNSFTSGPNDETEVYDEQMKQLFAHFKSEQVSEFVLDLRYNPGGLLTSAQLMTSFLAPAEALGKTFCYQEYNDKQEKSNKETKFLKSTDLGNANLDLERIYVLIGSTTASASEAVINCLIPYMGRSNITIIGEQSIGKRVGSNIFGTKDDYDWLLHPITFRIYNADRTADYEGGFEPDVPVEELVIGNDLLPFGDTQELLLSEAISRITGANVRSIKTRTAVEDTPKAIPAFYNRKVGGLIDKSDNLE